MSLGFSQSDSELLESILMSRRDVRGNRFTAQAVSEETIERLLDAALYAPSVGFSQPWQFVVIRDDAIKKKVHASFQTANQSAQSLFSDEKQKQYQSLKLEGILEAPVNLAIFYKPSDKPVLGQTSMSDMGRFSVVCAIQNLWLMARSLNVGVGWVSIVESQQVKQAVNAPEDLELIGYLCIGYVDEFLDKPELEIKGWEKKKARQDIVSFEQFE